MSHRRPSSTSTYGPEWQHSTETGSNMAKQRTSYPVTHEETARRASASTSNGSHPRKKGFFAKLFSFSCLEFDETSDPVAKYRKKHEALYGPSPPEPLPPFTPPFQAALQSDLSHPYSTTFTPGFADMSSSSVDTTGEQPSQSHRLFVPAPVVDRVLDQKPPGVYAKPHGSFAGGTTGGSGAGGAGGCGGGGC